MFTVEVCSYWSMFSAMWSFQNAVTAAQSVRLPNERVLRSGDYQSERNFPIGEDAKGAATLTAEAGLSLAKALRPKGMGLVREDVAVPAPSVAVAFAVHRVPLAPSSGGVAAVGAEVVGI